MINNDFFVFDEKLGIRIPSFINDWDDYNREEQLFIIQEWELERSKIPDRIKNVEGKIMGFQEEMFEMSFEEYCEVHKQVVELAGIINDLNIWFRTEGVLTK